jgi:hypothetical protein
MPNFFLNFTGLCAFVPTTGKHEMRVVLCDASHPMGPHDKPHRPVLVFLRDSWREESGTRKWDERFQDPTGRELYLCSMEDQDFTIAGSKPDHLYYDLSVKQGCPSVADAKDRDLFSWIGSMSGINHGSADIDDRCLSPTNASTEVAARILLTDGQLTTVKLACQPEGAVVRWMFKPESLSGNPSLHEQALAEEVRLKVEFPGPYLELNSVMGIHGRAPQALLPLRLYPSAEGLIVWIANMPDHDIKSRIYIGSPPKGSAKRQEIDHHFMHYYKLLKSGVSMNVPHPLMDCDAIIEPNVNNPKCPPVLLNSAS